MFFAFSHPPHVLNMFLNFWPFSASCSYKKVLIKKESADSNVLVSFSFNKVNSYDGIAENPSYGNVINHHSDVIKQEG